MGQAYAYLDLVWKREEQTQFGRLDRWWDSNVKIKLKCSGRTRTGFFRQSIAQMAVSCLTAIVRQIAQNYRRFLHSSATVSF